MNNGISHYRPQPPKVVIIGGGLAGLAAAAALVDQGLEITLLESRPRLGGRASSFTDPMTGEHVDNCQHVSMACCTNLTDFCRRIDIQKYFRRDRELVFLDPEGKISRLSAGSLPAPLHLTGSFLRAKYLTLSEKLRVAYGLARLRFFTNTHSSEPFADWLHANGQTLRTINRYWAPVLVSALNERLEQMDVGHARKVFLDGFLRNRDGFQLEIPLIPLGELYGKNLERWLCDQGVNVRLTTGVKSVESDDEGAISHVLLRNGETIPADFVIVTVPFDRVKDLLADPVAQRIPALQHIDALESSPITGVHLWFDRPICPFDHVVTPGRLIQWVFNHTRIQGRRSGESENSEYLQIVISASYDLIDRDRDEILALVRADLADIWPESADAKLLRSWVVTEHGATFAVRPGVEYHRLHQRTPVEGLFFAGDWTSTGWPATMEGAVRSGYLAAEDVLEDLGRPQVLVKGEQKPGLLSRLLLGSASPPNYMTTFHHTLMPLPPQRNNREVVPLSQV